MREPLARELHNAAFVFVGNPRFRGSPPGCAGPVACRGRGLVAYIAFKTAEGLAVRQGLRMMQRHLDEHRQLVEQLGRQPTKDEYRQHFDALARERRRS